MPVAPNHAAAATALGGALALLFLARRRRTRAAIAASAACPLEVEQFPTYVISLGRRPARRSSALARVVEAGLRAAEVFEAVDGRDLDAKELRRREVTLYAGWRLVGSDNRFFDRELKWGEVGCALSHLAVWRRVRELGTAPLAVVLEDDVDFVPGFAELLRAALDEVAALVAAGATAPPDALYLARNAVRPECDRLLPPSGAAAPRVRLVVPGFSLKTTAYVLWPRGAAKLLASGLERRLIPVDDFLALTYAPHESVKGKPRPDLDALFADAPRLSMLAVRPQLCRERRGVSDTERSSFVDAAGA